MKNRVLIIAILFIAIFTVGKVTVYNKVFKTGEKEVDFFKNFNKKSDDKYLNVLVMGVDEEEIRTDVLFVASFNKETKNINILSIPRDTMVKLDDKIIEKMEYKRNIPENKIVKINEVHGFAGRQNANDISLYEVEKLLNFDINYYIKININAFKKIVDGVGGINMDVPQDMYHTDSHQELYINLKKGYQHLDGDKAEQLVRFRRYKDGDLGRIKVQQKFLEKFINKLLKYKNNPGFLTEMSKTMVAYVETDCPLNKSLEYIKYVEHVDFNNVHMETLQGNVGIRINDKEYFKADEKALEKAVERLKFESNSKIKDYDITIINASEKTGLATYYKELLKKYGFKVDLKWPEEENSNLKNTKVLVKDKKYNEYFIKLFNNANIEVDESLVDTSAKIILGKNETK